jgi:hypothetical protein
MTLSTCCLWHGFIPRYPAFFLIAFLYTEIYKNFTRTSDYFFPNVSSGVKTLVGFIATQTFASYTTCNYILTEFYRMHVFNLNMGYFLVWAFGAAFVVSQVMASVAPKKKRANRVEAKKAR